MVLIITGTGKRVAKSYDGSSAGAPLLHVEYKTGDGAPSSNQPPVVHAGSDQTITLSTRASLTGSVTDDGQPNPPGALTVTWSQQSGPGTVTFEDMHTAATTASFSAVGTYVLQLTGSDGALSASADVTIMVNDPPATNQPPVVTAGPDQTITLSARATLAGTVHDDGLPNPPAALTMTWSMVSGPGTVTFAAAAANTTATFSAAGSYVLRLTASDGARSASDDMTVTVVTTGSTAVVETRIAAGTDDAEQKSADGSMDLSSSNVDLGTKPSGMRFRLSIPRGARIVRAYVQFVTDTTDTGATALTIEGEASDNAPTFGSSKNNIVNRLRTFHHVSWAPPAWTTVGAAGLDQRTPDLSAIIQEIVDRPGWTSGNGLALIITGTGVRHGMSFDRRAASAALLHVEYAQ
jgi:hypothetical protein